MKIKKRSSQVGSLFLWKGNVLHEYSCFSRKTRSRKEFANALGKATNKGTHCIVNSDLMNGEVVVTWGIGHLVGLAEPEAYSADYKKWSMDNLPIIPSQMKYQVNKRTSKQFNAVKGLLKQADSSSLQPTQIVKVKILHTVY